MEEDGKVRLEYQRVSGVITTDRGNSFEFLNAVNYACTRVDGYSVVAAVSSRNDITIQITQHITDGRGRPITIDTGGYEWHMGSDGALINHEDNFNSRIEHESPAAATQAQSIGAKIRQYMNDGEIQPTEARELLNFIRSSGRNLPD